MWLCSRKFGTVVRFFEISGVITMPERCAAVVGMNAHAALERTHRMDR